MHYENSIIDKLRELDEIVIYGAGLMGRALMTCLTDSPYQLKVTCFLVESLENNPDEIGGIPVIDSCHAEEYRTVPILVALHEKHIFSAMEQLEREGFSNLIPVSFDSDIWSDIRGNWFYEFQCNNRLPFVDFDEEVNKQLHVYVVHSVADKKLKEDRQNKSYEIPIQVGADLTDKRICAVLDNQGENISEKNPWYCELTALYWIWKNDRSRYIGLCHYRRKFEISEKQAMQLLESNIDVVVTIPVLNFDGVKNQYCRDHEECDWDIMMEAIEKLHPEYMSVANEVQNGIYYYAYNMFIARREVLVEYCEWLFPILSYCESKIGIKPRYIGFLAERLLTIFFEYNKQYRLTVAKKHFIES